MLAVKNEGGSREDGFFQILTKRGGAYQRGELIGKGLNRAFTVLLHIR